MVLAELITAGALAFGVGASDCKYERPPEMNLHSWHVSVEPNTRDLCQFYLTAAAFRTTGLVVERYNVRFAAGCSFDGAAAGHAMYSWDPGARKAYEPEPPPRDHADPMHAWNVKADADEDEYVKRFVEHLRAKTYWERRDSPSYVSRQQFADEEHRHIRHLYPVHKHEICIVPGYNFWNVAFHELYHVHQASTPQSACTWEIFEGAATYAASFKRGDYRNWGRRIHVREYFTELERHHSRDYILRFWQDSAASGNCDADWRAYFGVEELVPSTYEGEG